MYNQVEFDVLCNDDQYFISDDVSMSTQELLGKLIEAVPIPVENKIILANNDFSKFVIKLITDCTTNGYYKTIVLGIDGSERYQIKASCILTDENGNHPFVVGNEFYAFSDFNITGLNNIIGFLTHCESRLESVQYAGLEEVMPEDFEITEDQFVGRCAKFATTSSITQSGWGYRLSSQEVINAFRFTLWDDDMDFSPIELYIQMSDTILSSPKNINCMFEKGLLLKMMFDECLK